MPTPRRFALVRTLFALVGASLLLIAPVACETTTPAPMEPFKRHRLESLSRTLDAARQALEELRQSLNKALDETDPALVPDGAPRQRLEDAYDQARRDLAVNQTKIRVARERLTQATRRGDDLFAEWDKEIGYYADAALQAQARAGYSRARERFDDAAAALARANELAPPLLVELSDRMLYFKHHRDQPDIVEPARTPARVQAMARTRQAVGDAVDAASVAVSRFVETEAGNN